MEWNGHERHGNGGEGMGLQQTKDGRRFMYIAHESAPKNFTVVEVTDPREPLVVCQTDLPHDRVRSSNSASTPARSSRTVLASGFPSRVTVDKSHNATGSASATTPQSRVASSHGGTERRASWATQSQTR